ncbi:MAG: decaprenyl-phosphate phosphoribosyltransferase [Anaerolineae bacterium]|nr:decaprenyl-phosphate phosphoribosyltransferase [Anaerolineae bacterium]MDH7474836.1 decaprenyl-phosphate phosphoribosyltransferase [Anaerolineae bacterium]
MIVGLIRTMRPKQWTKNLFVFAALVFDRKLTNPVLFAKTLVAFILLCLVSSTVYLINDLVDIEKDRQHPSKRLRPLPSGQLKPVVAIVAAILIPAISLPSAFLLNLYFGLIVTVYLLVMIAYSFWLKNVVIVDVLTIAAGFVLRVAAGIPMVHVVRFSPWLYVCTTLLALFIGFGKRRHELSLLQANANNHRAVLNDYNLTFLDEMIGVVTASTVMAYSLYTFSAEGLPPNHAMMLTIPFVLYGIFRYLYLIHVRNEGGTPEEIILRDKSLLADVLLWGLSVIVILYFFKP